MADTPRGRFCWYELMTKDPQAAPGFYGRVTGWGTASWDGGDMPYTMWMNGETSIGGIMQLPEEAAAAGAPSHWLAYISTPDVAETTEKAKGLGATVLHGPMEIPEVGAITVLQDPQGAVFAAYQPAGDAPGHDGERSAGEVSWHELATSDWEAAWSFYSELFDWEKDEAMDMGEMGTYQIFRRGSLQLGGVFNRPPTMPVSAWTVYVSVPDLDASVSAVQAGGGSVVNGPMEVPGGDRIAVCMDPAGAMFALHAKAG